MNQAGMQNNAVPYATSPSSEPEADGCGLRVSKLLGFYTRPCSAMEMVYIYTHCGLSQLRVTAINPMCTGEELGLPQHKIPLTLS